MGPSVIRGERGATMLSRVADSLYWMSRYLERAEHTARVLHVHLNLVLEQPPEINAGRWPLVYGVLGMARDPESERSTHRMTRHLCFDAAERSSIAGSITAARFNARQVREQISSEMWEQLNRLYHDIRNVQYGEQPDVDPHEFLTSVTDGSAFFQGITDSTMSHGEGWQFIQLGRYIERAQRLAKMLDVHYRHYWPAHNATDTEPSPNDYPEWIGLLQCATAFEAYCKVHTPIIYPRHVADFLMLSDNFPHSLRFSVERMHLALSAISEVSPSRRGSKVVRLAGRLKSMLGFSQIDEILAPGLGVTIEDLGRQCVQIHDGIYQAFLTYPIEAALEV